MTLASVWRLLMKRPPPPPAQRIAPRCASCPSIAHAIHSHTIQTRIDVYWGTGKRKRKEVKGRESEKEFIILEEEIKGTEKDSRKK